MNVYFTASIVGKRQYVKQYEAIVSLIRAKGYIVTADHILHTTESQIHLETREQRLTFHKQLKEWIQECDAMVAEVSFPSISVGYEISLAIQNRKPILLLYSNGAPPSLFIHHSEENVLCEKYTLQSLPEILEGFLSYASGAADSRFTFYVTSQIASFLEKVSKKEKIPKSVYLRKLIEQHIKERRDI